MIIRPATDQDLPEIVQLSTASLGGLGGMRTKEYWKWKHQQNPFGESPVLLAFEDDKLVGLRAFLKWRFRYKGKSFLAYRAVDTATHPDFRGKGIFSKLTLQLVEQLRAGEPSVIFNTPNSKSMPGYLKMGWREAGKTRLLVKISPFNLLRNQFASGFADPASPIMFPEDFRDVLSSWVNMHQYIVMTDYSMEYLQWRYVETPGLSYGAKHVKENNNQALVIYRIKKSKRLTELRINEVFFAGDHAKKNVSSAIHELSEKYRPDVITIVVDPKGIITEALPFGFFKSEKSGLTITSRKVNDDALASLVLNRNEWYYSSGTLELF